MAKLTTEEEQVATIVMELIKKRDDVQEKITTYQGKCQHPYVDKWAGKKPAKYARLAWTSPIQVTHDQTSIFNP